MKKREERLRGEWNSSKYNNILIMEVPEGMENQKGGIMKVQEER